MIYNSKKKLALFAILALTFGVSHSLVCDLLDSDQLSHTHSIIQPAFMGADPEETEDRGPALKVQDVLPTPQSEPFQTVTVKIPTEEPSDVPDLS